MLTLAEIQEKLWDWNKFKQPISEHPTHNLPRLMEMLVKDTELEDIKLLVDEVNRIVLSKRDGVWGVYGDVLFNSLPVSAEAEFLVRNVARIPTPFWAEELSLRGEPSQALFYYKENACPIYPDNPAESFPDGNWKGGIKKLWDSQSSYSMKETPAGFSRIVEEYHRNLGVRNLSEERSEHIRYAETILAECQEYLTVLNQEGRTIGCLPFICYDGIISGHQPYTTEGVTATALFVELYREGVRRGCHTMLLGSIAASGEDNCYLWKKKFSKRSKSQVCSFIKMRHISDFGTQVKPPYYLEDRLICEKLS